MEDPTPDPFPWDQWSIDFELSGARVVATLGSDGGAIVETAPRLHCTEGRLYTFERVSDGSALHQLEYHFSFTTRTNPDDFGAQSVLGRIVITGRHANGLMLEIRGDGWIGYDDKGNLDGRFDDPPVIISEDHEPDEDEAEEETVTRRSIDFPMPPQFKRATVRVPDRDDPWLG